MGMGFRVNESNFDYICEIPSMSICKGNELQITKFFLTSGNSYCNQFICSSTFTGYNRTFRWGFFRREAYTNKLITETQTIDKFSIENNQTLNLGWVPFLGSVFSDCN